MFVWLNTLIKLQLVTINLKYDDLIVCQKPQIFRDNMLQSIKHRAEI